MNMEESREEFRRSGEEERKLKMVKYKTWNDLETGIICIQGRIWDGTCVQLQTTKLGNLILKKIYRRC